MPSVRPWMPACCGLAATLEASLLLTAHDHQGSLEVDLIEHVHVHPLGDLSGLPDRNIRY
jgi:hypothetical protein